MTTEQAEILNRLFEDGYLIQIVIPGQEIDENVTMVEQNENGDWVYHQDSLGVEELTAKDISEVRVFARVDWLVQIGHEIDNEDHYATMVGKRSLQDWNEDLDKAYNI